LAFGKKTSETLDCTKSQTKTAKLLGLSFDQVHRVMHNFVARGMKNRSLDERHYYLSIDEKAVLKGHDYLSVLSDEATGVVIDVVEGRTKESVAELCQKLSLDQRSEVKTVCTDMWDAFIYGAKEFFPNALHCHDNFHLVGYLNKAVDKVRKREVKQVELLKNTKYVWLKDKSDFTEKQRVIFYKIDQANYQTARAWKIKENFRDIQFRQQSIQDAFHLLSQWRRNAINSQIPEIKEVVDMFDRHFQGILNAMMTGSNNARAERINGAIEELKRIGRGYKNKQNFRIAILFFHGDLNGYPQKSQ
jgi:transposase